MSYYAFVPCVLSGMRTDKGMLLPAHISMAESMAKKPYDFSAGFFSRMVFLLPLCQGETCAVF